MPLPNLDAQISDLVVGATWTVRYQVRSTPLAETLDKAWFAIKANIDDADGAALILKEVSSVDAPGTGQIEDTGAGDRVGAVRFDLAPADTDNLTAGEKYFFGAQVKTSAGKIFPLEGGIIIPRPKVVQAQS